MLLTWMLACAADAEDVVREAKPSKDDHDGPFDTTDSSTTPETGDSGEATTATPAVTASTILTALGDCTTFPGTEKFANNDGGSETISMCATVGTLWFTADFDVDCDGGRSAACKADPYYQSETSANDSHGDPLDASTLPFTVLPLDSNGFSLSGADLHLGSVTAVIYKGKLVWAVLGDRGPTGTVGEGSYALAEALGINPDPVSGGAEGGITMVFFTGDDAKVSPIERTTEAERVGVAQAEALIAGKP